MALACNQVRFLGLTQCKATCENGITRASGEKMSLSREMSALASEYRAKLNSTKVSYYANGKYNQVNYKYLMGYGKDFSPILNGTAPVKNDKSMLLTDYKGDVVLGNDYAGAILSVLGSSAMDHLGRGKTFSTDRIPEMLAYVCPGYDAKVFEAVMKGDKVPSEYSANILNTYTNTDTGNDTTVDNTDRATATVQKLLDFYLPIFKSAAANGWTAEQALKTIDGWKATKKK